MFDAQGERVLKARVRAAAEDGKANTALTALLAKEIGVAKSKVAIARGAAARLKLVNIEGANASDIEALFQRYAEKT